MGGARKGNDRIGKAGANVGEMNFEKQKHACVCEKSARNTDPSPFSEPPTPELVHFIFTPPSEPPEDLGYGYNTFVPLMGTS